MEMPRSAKALQTDARRYPRMSMPVLAHGIRQIISRLPGCPAAPECKDNHQGKPRHGLKSKNLSNESACDVSFVRVSSNCSRAISTHHAAWCCRPKVRPRIGGGGALQFQGRGPR